ncbi:MAG: DUF4830 domain-containing protein [Ruminococcus sp.]|nr:DUF4830 domain-containing protein [Ruminococcus sp.]
MTASTVKENYREKRKRTKIKTVILITLLVLLGLLAYFVLIAKEEAEDDKRFTFEGNAQRVAFLNSYGLIVEPDPEREEITVPAEFNAAFEKYNELQQSQGFDLKPFGGREVTRYTYKILNYPDLPENVYVNLLFDDHRLIAADITYNDADSGFTKPLIPETMQETI